jgi:hypothetical protein
LIGNYLPIRPITYLVNISNNENNPQIQHIQLYPTILPWATFNTNYIIVRNVEILFFSNNKKSLEENVESSRMFLFVEMKISKLINYSLGAY